MCSNKELSSDMRRLTASLEKLDEKLGETIISAAKVSARFETWEETRCEVNTTEIKELRQKVDEVKDVATSAAFKAAAMYSLGLLFIGTLITVAIKRTIGA